MFEFEAGAEYYLSMESTNDSKGGSASYSIDMWHPDTLGGGGGELIGLDEDLGGGGLIGLDEDLGGGGMLGGGIIPLGNVIALEPLDDKSASQGFLLA